LVLQRIKTTDANQSSMPFSTHDVLTITKPLADQIKTLTDQNKKQAEQIKIQDDQIKRLTSHGTMLMGSIKDHKEHIRNIDAVYKKKIESLEKKIEYYTTKIESLKQENLELKTMVNKLTKS